MAKTKPAVAPKREVKPKQSAPVKPIPWAKYGMWAALVVISITFWFLYNTIFDHKPDMNGDNFAYILLGKRFIAGLGFTDATSRELRPHIHFSPGYPLMIAGIMKIFGEEQDTISFANGVMMYLSLILLFFIGRRLTGSTIAAFVIAFLCAVNSFLLRFSTITMSEIPYVFICTLAIYTFIRAVDDPRNWKSPWLYISIALMVFSYYMKANSIAFLVGMGAYFLFSRDWRRMLISVVLFIAAIFPWYLRTKRTGSSYMSQMMQVNPYKPELGKVTLPTMIERIHSNIIRYFTCDIPLNIFPNETNADKASTGYWILGMAMLGLMLWGLYKLKDLRLLILGYFAGSLAILMIWPTEYGFIRYATPFVPIILLLCINGIKALADLAIGEKNGSYVTLGFLLVGLVYSKPIDQLEEQARQPIQPNYENYFAIARWAKEHTPKDATFSARKPDMFIYYSDRMCIGDKPSLIDTEVLDFFREHKVDYVCVEQLGFSSTGKYLIPALQKNPANFEVVYHLPNPDTYLLKFKP
ncbi:MAG: repeat protein [Bacteroidetes bacterium]|nr:repeat protein [Bacteroidota bacterium]